SPEMVPLLSHEVRTRQPVSPTLTFHPVLPVPEYLTHRTAPAVAFVSTYSVPTSAVTTPSGEPVPVFSHWDGSPGGPSSPGSPCGPVRFAKNSRLPSAPMRNMSPVDSTYTHWPGFESAGSSSSGSSMCQILGETAPLDSPRCLSHSSAKFSSSAGSPAAT